MATVITSECINCGACEPECPNTAIYQGGVEWQAPDGSMHAAISNDIFYIVPEKCTECVGFYDQEACAKVCPVDCCVPDPALPESEAVLLERARALHPDKTIPDDAPSRFKKEGAAAPAAVKPAAEPKPAAPAPAAAAPARCRPGGRRGRQRRAGPPRSRRVGDPDRLLPLQRRVHRALPLLPRRCRLLLPALPGDVRADAQHGARRGGGAGAVPCALDARLDRKSTRLNSSHQSTSRMP